LNDVILKSKTQKSNKRVNKNVNSAALTR
jgi:hypothetical protein